MSSHHHGGEHDHGSDHHHEEVHVGHVHPSGHGPGHGHTHGVVDPSIASTARGLWALKWSFVGLMVTAVIQVVVVVLSGSVALLADTIHNFADALTALPLGLAFWLSRRPATKRYTYGYGRSEDLAGIFIVVTIAVSSAVAGWEAVNRLVHPHHVHKVGWVIVAGLVGCAGNELVAVYRI